MADNLDGLFDSDPGFLEELASGTDDPAQSEALMQPGHGQMANIMQQGHSVPGYNMGAMKPGSGFPNMQYQNQQQQQPSYPQQQNFSSQYNNQQMYSQSMTTSQPQGQMNQMMGSQFGGQPQIHQGHGMYPFNGTSAGQAGPRLPNPGQQGMGQMQGWNQNPGMFNQQQQQQQQYLPQHEYSIPNSTNQMPHLQAQPQQQFPTSQSQPNSGMYMQRIVSPGAMNNMPASQPGMQQPMYQQQRMGGSQSYSNVNMSNSNVANSGSMMMQSNQQQYMQQQQQPNSQHQFQQQFPYRSTPQMQQGNMGDTNMGSQQQPQQGSIYPLGNTAQANMPPRQRMPFNNMNNMSNMNNVSQPRASVPMLSPHPTPPPSSPGMLSPTGSASSHQGNYNQMDASPNHQPPPMQPLSAPQSNTMNESMPVVGGKTSKAKSNKSKKNAKTNQPPSGQVSPVKNVLSPSAAVTSPTNTNAEMQNLSQQIQQLYGMPQTAATQQKIAELQEKLRALKSQQMQMSPRPGQQQQQLPGNPAAGSVQGSGASQLYQQSPDQQPQIQQNLSPTKQGQPQSHLQPGMQMGIPQAQRLPSPQMSRLSPGSQPMPIGQSNMQQQVGAGLRPSTPLQQGQIIMQTNPNCQTGAPQNILIIRPQSQQQGVMRMSSSQPPGGAMPHPGAPNVPTLTSLPQPVLNGTAQAPQQIIIRQSQPGNQPLIIQGSGSMPCEPDSTSETTSQQEKANKICAEAIAKAQMTGASSSLPRVIQPPELPASLGELDSIDDNAEEKPKKKRKYTPRKERTSKEPKQPKEKKKKKEKSSKAAKVKEQLEVSEDMNESMSMSAVESIPTMATDDDDGFKLEIDESFAEEKQKKPKKKKEKSEKTPRSEKKKPKKPPATFLMSKKRKRRGSSDGSDIEMKITPPPSPENDDLKRRSGRNVKRKKYMDDVDLNLSDEDTLDVVGDGTEGAVVKPVLFVENPSEEDAIVVDKILGCRIRKPDPDEEEQEEVEEFFVKYKNFSYLHCEWHTEAEIKDKRIQGKIKRFKQKRQQVVDIYDEEEELFNPDYVEVDRVLEESKTVDPNTEEEVTHYLVKWRSLPYEDSTWELQQDVDPEKVKVFKRVSALPPEDERKHKSRPKPTDWKELKECHTYKGGNQLREYQLEGVNWLAFNWYKKQNCILADEMGLGKTIQSITFLEEMYNYGIRGPFLVVAPLSTIANWQREFETWTDINAITYHGTSPSRYMLQEYEMYYRDEEGNKITDFYKFHAIITTYEIILSDLELLRSIDWRCIIIDEAHRLKNKNCSLIKCLRIFDFEHKVLMSGTPLQNNVEELFSLLNFLEPSQFSSSDAFLAEFGNLRTEEQVEKLKAILKPMMLRRLKEDVEKNLAAKEETIIEVELTNIQKKYYRAILEKNFSYLCKGANSTNVPSLLNTMMELRKCCNHPYLLNGAEENILSELREKEGREPEHIGALVQASGKFVLLDKLLPRLKHGGHRVLIFSQMIRVLDIIEDYLIHKKYLYERLDGRIRGNLRQEAIDRYSKPDSDRFVFLICTKAGGLGINLTAADTVIIYDSDWNPQNDLQAQARCHRIGQSKMVKVYRLITRNSYEREMFNRASMKLGLDKAVLQSMGGDKLNPQQQLTKREIEDLLRKGAYGALMDDDNAGDKFCEEDIEQILAGRTQVIQIESEGKGSTFSKASFSASANRDDIDINDPEFWQKWAKKADVDTGTLETRELIVDEPRVRKRTTRYGNNDSMAEISDLGSDSDTENDDEDSKKGGRKTRRGRRGDDDDTDFERERHRAKVSGGGYGRSELFKVEKGLLHYGWGRWKDILGHSRFKRPMDEKDVENVAKAILLYGLQYYKGDERIKEFISDMISSDKDGGLKNHSGLSAPVPRGRKGKKAKDQETHFDANEEIEKAGIKMDRDIVFNKNSYKRHIHRHSNKVLLRVRTLYYIKHELLGDVVDQIDQGMHVKDINLPAPVADNEPPAYWWDELADKSLLVGTYKHGYEKYNLMRQDPMLVFLECCGPPDGAALAAEMKDDDEGDDIDENSILKDDDEDDSLACPPDTPATPRRGATATPAATPRPEGEEGGEADKLPFPTPSEMNTRLRRIITTYQRDFKKQQLKQQQQAKKMEKREKLDAVFKEREARRRETQMKWTRREETDFYRVVSTYGIEFDRHKGRYIWDKFRVMAKLEKKTDEQLTEYFISFYHMCLRVCRKIKEESYPPTPVYIEQITEERANRCIARIDLLSKIREEIVVHPKMEHRIKNCQKSLDLPAWWISGKHDRELLIGAAKNGLARTEYYIMNDPALSFLDNIKAFLKTRPVSPSFGKEGEKKEAKETLGEETEKKEEKVKKEDIKSETEAPDENDKDGERKVKGEENQIEPMEVDKEDTKCTKVETDNISPKKENASEDKNSEKENVVKSEVNDSDETEIKPEVKSEKPEAVGDDEDTDIDENSADFMAEENNKTEEKTTPLKQDPDAKVEVTSGKEEMKEDPDEELCMAMEGEESQADLLNSVSQTLLAQWPKDRIVFHRLEQICYCVETGDWPFPPKMKNAHILGIDSAGSTPTRSLTPKHEDDGRPNSVDRASERSVDKPKKERDFEGESLKMTFHKKEKNKRSMESVEAEKARIQAILAQSKAVSQAASSDDSQQESLVSSASASQVSWTPWLTSTPTPPPPPPTSSMHGLHFPQFQNCNDFLGGVDSPFLNGSHLSEEEMMMNRHLLEQGLLFPRSGRRGRKRKEEKLAEIAMAEALARRQTARALAGFDSDSRVPVINLEDGSRLSGEDAPLKRNLESWLEKHPGYMVDSRGEELEEGEIVSSEFGERRKGRKPKFDPAFLEVEKLTGEENVSVINRLTCKKITGAKAPPLRFLAEWLEQNPMWDVDPKWADLVRAKGSLPKQLLPRIVTSSRRGRRPRDSPLPHSMMHMSDPHQAAALAASMEAAQLAQLLSAGFGKMPMPFGSIQGLGLNPILGLSAFGFGLPGSPLSESPSSSKSESLKQKESSKASGSKDDKEKSKEEEKSASPHPSFPMMLNPLLYNPALLAAHGLNFPLPTSLAGLDPSLLNGHSPGKQETSTSSSSHKSSRNKSGNGDQNIAEDLSIKSKSKPLVENTTEAHSSSKPKISRDVSFDSDDMPCDLSMKSKSKEDKSKQKICNSDKLSRIVDTLKFRVNKMDETSSKGLDDEVKKSSLDMALNLKSKPHHSHKEWEEGRSSSSSKKDVVNSTPHKSSSSSSAHSNHTSKEPVPRIVQELLAAKHQRELEEQLAHEEKLVLEDRRIAAKKLESLAAKQKLLKESTASQSARDKDKNGDTEADSEIS